MIREIHKKLVEGVRGGNADPGKYRRIQNYVANESTGEVIYTPPSAAEIPSMMSELVKWLNADLEIHPVLISGIAQFQLIHIHPFLDGNGRTSRLLSTLYLYKSGYDFKRLFTISEYYDRDRQTFYKTIQNVRENNLDMTEWLNYFITGLETQMIEVKERGEQVLRSPLCQDRCRCAKKASHAVPVMRVGLSVSFTAFYCPKTIQDDLMSETPKTDPLIFPDDPEKWVDPYGDRLYRFTLARVRDRSVAEDLVRETFLT